MTNQAAVVMLRGPGYTLASDDPLIVAMVADLLATGAQQLASASRLRQRIRKVGPAAEQACEESTCP